MKKIKIIVIFISTAILCSVNFAQADNSSYPWFVREINRIEDEAEPLEGQRVNTPKIGGLRGLGSSRFMLFDAFLLNKNLSEIEQIYNDEMLTQPEFSGDIGTENALYQFHRQALSNDMKLVRVSYHPYAEYLFLSKADVPKPIAYYLFDDQNVCIGYLVMDLVEVTNSFPLLSEIKQMPKDPYGLKDVLTIPADKEIEFYQRPDQNQYTERFALVKILKDKDKLSAQRMSNQYLGLIAFYPDKYHSVMFPYIRDDLNFNLEKYAAWIN